MATKVVPGVALLPQINIVSLNSKLVEAAKRVRCFSQPSGEEMGQVALWNFTHLSLPPPAGDILALLFAFTVGDGNPELVMSIWEDYWDYFHCEFCSQTGGDLDVYVDGTLKRSVRGGSPGYFSIILP